MKIKSSINNGVVLLVYPPTGPVIAEPPYSIMYLASWLIQHGVKTLLVDARFDNIERIIRDECAEDKIVLAGISAMTGPQIVHGLECARIIRRILPDVPIVWGGIHPTIETDSTLSHSLVDKVITGPGESALLNLYRNLTAGESINKVAESDFVPLDKIFPMPWDTIKLERYVDTSSYDVPAFYLFTSRGCRYRCTFCYSWGMKTPWEGLNSDMVLAEVDEVISRLPQIGIIAFHDDNASCDMKRLEKIVIGMHERNIPYVISSHPGDVTRDAVEMHRECGCARMDFAIESGSNRVLSILGKGIDRDVAERAVRICSKAEIPCYISFMMGHPSETLDDIYMTMDFMDRMRRISPLVNLSDLKIFTPYPGTPAFDESVNHGFQVPETLQEWGKMYWNSANLPWAPPDKLLDRISFTSLLAFCSFRISAGTGLHPEILAPVTMAARKIWLKRRFGHPMIRIGTYMMNYGMRLLSAGPLLKMFKKAISGGQSIRIGREL